MMDQGWWGVSLGGSLYRIVLVLNALVVHIRIKLPAKIVTNMAEEFLTEICSYPYKISWAGGGLYRNVLLFNALHSSSKIT